MMKSFIECSRQSEAEENQELKSRLEAQENSIPDTIRSNVTDFLKANYATDELSVSLETRRTQLAPFVTEEYLNELCPLESSPPSSVASKKLIFKTIPANPSLLPNPKDSQTMPLTSHFIVHKKFRIEIQVKFNLSMVP